MKRREFLQRSTVTLASLQVDFAGFFKNFFSSEPENELSNETPEQRLRNRLLEYLNKVYREYGSKEPLPRFREDLFQFVYADQTASNSVNEKIVAGWRQEATSAARELRVLNGSFELRDEVKRSITRNDGRQIEGYADTPESLLALAKIEPSDSEQAQYDRMIDAYLRYSTEQSFSDVEHGRQLNRWRLRSVLRLDLKYLNEKELEAYYGLMGYQEEIKKLKKENANDAEIQKAQKEFDQFQGTAEGASVKLVYPMDQWRGLGNYTRALAAVWGSSRTSFDRTLALKNIALCVDHWEQVAEQFHWLIPRYLSLEGKRIHDAAAPDDSIAPLVSETVKIAFALKQIGQMELAERVAAFGDRVMDATTKSFWHENGTHAVEGRMVATGLHGGHGNASEATEATDDTDTAVHRWLNEHDTRDLPGDGTRVALARMQLVRYTIAKESLTEDEYARVEDHIRKSLAELWTYVLMAEKKEPLLEWYDDAPQPHPASPQKQKLFLDKVIPSSGFVDTPGNLPKRFNEPAVYSSESEWPEAFGAVKALRSDPELFTQLGKHLGRDNSLFEEIDFLTQHAHHLFEQMTMDAYAISVQRRRSLGKITDLGKRDQEERSILQSVAGAYSKIMGFLASGKRLDRNGKVIRFSGVQNRLVME